MKHSDWLARGLAALYLFFWLGGVGAYVFLDGPPAHVTWTAPLFLFLAGTLVLLGSRDRGRLLMCGTLGFCAELAGVWTGYPFGAYQYTSQLAPSLLDVPLVMVAAWLILLAYVRDMLRPLQLSRVVEVVIASAWMTAIDLVIDPLAAGPLNYWQWDHDGWYYGIPMTNFVGWYVISLVVFGCAGPAWHANATARWVGFSIVLFFGCLAIAVGYIGVGVVAGALLTLHGFAYYRLHAPSNAVRVGDQPPQ